MHDLKPFRLLIDLAYLINLINLINLMND